MPEVEFKVTLRIIDFGKQVIEKRKNGFKTTYVDSVINALNFIPEEYIEDLSDDDKSYLSQVNTGSLRADLLEYLQSGLKEQTPYNVALFELSKKFDLFPQITEDVYIEVPTNQYTDANIELTVGDEVFNIDKYAVACKDENNNELFGFMVKINFENEILEKIREEGYK